MRTSPKYSATFLNMICISRFWALDFCIYLLRFINQRVQILWFLLTWDLKVNAKLWQGFRQDLGCTIKSYWYFSRCASYNFPVEFNFILPISNLTLNLHGVKTDFSNLPYKWHFLHNSMLILRSRKDAAYKFSLKRRPITGPISTIRC
jgi:hypothetical protein